jgi:hypothetical protein
MHPNVDDARRALAAHALRLEEDAPPRVVQAYGDAIKLAARDAVQVRVLTDRASNEIPIVRVPELSSDVHDLKNLGDIAGLLMRGGV